MPTFRQLTTSLFAGLLMLAAACADNTAPRRDCPDGTPTGNQECEPD